MLRVLLAGTLLMTGSLCTYKAVAGNRMVADTVIDAWAELYRVQEMINDTPYHYYSINYIRQQADTVAIDDTTMIWIHKHYNMFNISIGKNEMLQDETINLSFDHERQIATLMPAFPLSRFFQIDHTDPGFFLPYVQSLNITDSGAYRKLSFQFDTLALFEQYDIVYDTANHYIRTIQFKIRYFTSEEARPAIVPYEKVTMIFSSRIYATNAVLASPYLLRQNGEYVLDPYYADYELINLLNQ